MLADSVGRTHPDPEAHLFASLLTATFSTAYIEALRRQRKGRTSREVQVTFISLIDRGFEGRRRHESNSICYCLRLRVQLRTPGKVSLGQPSTRVPYSNSGDFVIYSCTRNLYFGGRLLLVAACANAAAFCQTQEHTGRPEFEVASIRLHANAGDRAYVQAFQGRLVMTNFSLNQLILFAYDVPNNQVSGEQAWMESNRYDIQAKAEGSSSVKQVEGPMLQALLEERFNLKVHRETAERPVYELTAEKGGVKMQLSKKAVALPILWIHSRRSLCQARRTPFFATFRDLEPTG